MFCRDHRCIFQTTNRVQTMGAALAQAQPDQERNSNRIADVGHGKTRIAARRAACNARK